MASSTRIHFLGTGNALNSERFQASILVQAGAARLLLDTGGGLELVRRLQQAAIDPQSIRHIFLSHRHLDHIGGVEPFLLSAGLLADNATRAPINVYGSPETLAATRSVLAAADAFGPTLWNQYLNWVELAVDEPVRIDAMTLRTFSVDHLPAEGGARGALLTHNGVKIVYSGDTCPHPSLIQAARGADLLIQVVGGPDGDPLIGAAHHTTAREAGEIAQQASVKSMALFHLPIESKYASVALVQEAQEQAPETKVFASSDGMEWTLA